MHQAATTAAGLGRPNLPVAVVPGHVDTQELSDLERNVREITVPAVVANLTARPGDAKRPEEPGRREIVASGSFEEINARFLAERWSDGLPIIPPTHAAVEAFLAHTTFDADKGLGVVLPDNREVTVWSIAVNGRDGRLPAGVHAGARRPGSLYGRPQLWG